MVSRRPEPVRLKYNAERDREMWLLRWEGKTYEEIGRVYGLSRERTRQLVWRADYRLCDLAGVPRVHWKRVSGEFIPVGRVRYYLPGRELSKAQQGGEADS